MIDYKTIGQRIKEARNAAGITQEKLAERTHVSANYMSKIETAREKPNLEMLDKISIAADVSLSSLLTGVVEERQYLRNDIEKMLDLCSPEKTRLIYDIISRITQFSE